MISLGWATGYRKQYNGELLSGAHRSAEQKLDI